MNILHIAPLHRRDDTRIFLKQCVSLSNSGFDVSCVFADGAGNEIVDDVEIIDCGPPPAGKFAKRLVPLYRAARIARERRPDLVHFHDGMFLPFAIFLALTGHRIVYDVHEDYREQIKSTRFPQSIKYLGSALYASLEWLGSRIFQAIVPATPHIARHFPFEKSTCVQNYPIFGQLGVGALGNPLPRKSFAYVGGISALRGAKEMVEAVQLVACRDARLELVGSFSPDSLRETTARLPGWKRVRFHGWLGRDSVARVLENSCAGLVLYHPAPNHLEAQPNKLFEYMSAGLPVIASNFPLWRQIIEEADCGLLVDPLSPAEISKAMDWILDHPEEAEAMGRRGLAAVQTKYNWDQEAKKLVDMYNELNVDNG